MDNDAFDKALIAAAYRLIAERGWRALTVAAAARAADLTLDRARARFPCKQAILARFGRLADESAVSLATTEGPVRDRLFDIVMRRIDTLQQHRDGVLALLSDLPRDPLTALAMAPLGLVSARWMLEAAGIETSGLIGPLRVKGMLAVWLYTVQAWRSDVSEDLSATMAALDRALTRAEQAEASFGGSGSGSPAPA